MGSKAAVDFHHAGTNYVTVNEVVGSKLSEVAGRISVDQGQAYILNPQGIVYHDGATIEGSVIMGTNTLNRDAFYENGHVLLNAPDISGPVLINGNLTIKEAGLLGIVAPYFSNKGHITGELHVAAGKEVRVDFGDRRLSFTLDGKLKEAFLHTTKASSIEGRAVTMTVGTVEKVLDETIRIDGDIRAQELTEEGGRLILKGGDTGEVIISGTLDASGKMDENGAPHSSPGGLISVTGQEVTAESTAQLKADGTTGGKILFGVDENFERSPTESVLKNPSVKATNVNILSGAKMKANATTGAAGSVIAIGKGHILFENTPSSIAISATSQKRPGGFVEASGKTATLEGIVSTQGGYYLMDPATYTVAPTGGDIRGAVLSANLTGGNVTISTNSGPNIITIEDLVEWTSPYSLNLVGVNTNLTSDGQILSHGTGNVNIRTSSNSSNITVASGGSIACDGGGQLRIFSNDGNAIMNSGSIPPEPVYYMNIYGPTTAGSQLGLDYISTHLDKNYALMNDVTMNSALSLIFTGALTGEPLGMQADNYTLVLPAFPIIEIPGSGDIVYGILFNQLQGATISSLNVTMPDQAFNATTSSSNVYVSSFAGTITNSTLQNIAATYGGLSSVLSAQTATNAYYGGIAGSITDSTLTNISVTTSAIGLILGVGPSGTGSLGGIAGLISSSSSLCSLEGGSMSGRLFATTPVAAPISLNYYVGGVAGMTTGTGTQVRISNFTNNSLLQTDLVNAETSGTVGNVFMGGIVGYSTVTGSDSNGLNLLSNTNTGAFEVLYPTGTTDKLALGGMVGSFEGNGTILNSSNSGAIINNNLSTNAPPAQINNLYQGGAVGYNAGLITNFTNTGPINISAINVGVNNSYQGGIVGVNAPGGSLLSSSNSGNITFTNKEDGAGTITNVYMGGAIGQNLSAGAITSSSNTGNVTFINGASDGAGSLAGVLSMGGFVGSSAVAIDGTSGTNTNSGNVSFTNGNGTGSNTGTVGTSVNVGGFAGTMEGDLSHAQSSGTVTVTDTNAGVSSGIFYVSGLVGATTGSILNSSSTSPVSYTENSTNSNPLYIAGLVAQISGGIIRSSSYNGALSTSVSASGTLGSSLYTAGLVAFSISDPTIQDSFLGPSSSIVITNEGAISYGINMGGLSAYGIASLSISSSYVSNDSTLTLINSGSVGASIFAGGLVGNSPGTITLSTSTYNGGTLTITNTGTVGGNLYYGGIIGSLSSTLIGTGASNTGTVTLYNGYTGGAGTIQGDLAMGGFVGNSTKAINGTAGANTTSGTVAFTNGNGSNSGTLGGGVYIGGFAGSMGGTLTAAQSSANVTITDTNLETPGILFYVGGLVGTTTADLLNSFSSGGVSYTENSVNSGGSLYIAGLVGSTSGNIESSYYTGGLSTVVSNTLGSLYMGGLVASTSGAQISASYLQSLAGISVKNSGTTAYVAMGGLSAYNSQALSISDSHILDIDLNLENSGPLLTDIFWGGLVGTSAAAVALSECSNNGNLLITNTGNVGGYLNYGGVFGSAYVGSTSESSSNTGNLTLTNGTTNSSGTIVSGIAMGGFVGNSAGALNGTNSSSGTVAFTNGVSGGNSGTVENNFNVGGFAGIMGGDLTSAQSSTNVEVINNSPLNPLGGTNVAGLVASTTGSILNSSASGDVSYTENSTTTNSLALAGLVAQTTGASINSSSYNGALYAGINSPANINGDLFLSGIVAIPNSALTISGTSLGANSSVSATNSGAITNLLIGGLSAANQAALTISGSSVGKNASLEIINTSTGTITGYVALGGLVSDAANAVTLSGSNNQGNLSFTNDGNFNADFYYGGIMASPRQGSTIDQTFSSGTMQVTNSGTLSGDLYMGGFAGQGQSVGDFTATNTYTTGPLTLNNSSTLSGDIYMGGFIGSALNASSIGTSYSRSSISLTNTGTITGTINSGSFAGSTVGTIGTSYVLQSALPIVGSGSSPGITSLQPIQMVEQKSFPSFNFGNIWTIQEFISTPYFINSSYIPYLPGFRPDSTYLQEIAKVIQTTLSILHDHRTLVAMEDPLKHVSVESPLQNEGFSLFGHEDVARSANETSLRTDEEESQGLFGTA